GPGRISGPAGSGRSRAARLLHMHGPRRDRRPVVVDARRLDGTWLFGMEPADDTSRRRIGWIEAADGTTLVIDHAESLGADLQADLAAYLETGTFRRQGGRETLRSTAAIVLIETGDAVAAELASRIGRRTIALTPLRERLDDIPLLVEHFARALRPAGGPIRLAPAAFRQLVAHDWPGNLHELRSVIEQALLSSKDVIEAACLPHLGGSPPGKSPEDEKRERALPERDWILDGLRRHRFRRSETAQFLGISRKTLYNKMRHYGLS
ncbi:MAG TPA: helix-turn-helix domain-containing protein, partial [Arenibaculum sp.]|nr:helix-turn-helix domain-containing protein [Arenibaculum sp.]